MSDKLSLHTDSEKIYSLARFKDTVIEGEDIFFINIIGHHHWSVKYQAETLMLVKYGVPYLPKPKLNEQKLREDIPRIFETSQNAVENIIKLAREAEKEKHGTMLLITEHAKEESIRLKNQSTTISPLQLSPGLLKSLTPVDGAIILSPNCTCYAFGVILDGLATNSGDPTRGARYNSAIRYINTTNCASFAIVFSEDGCIDFIPDLMVSA